MDISCLKQPRVIAGADPGGPVPPFQKFFVHVVFILYVQHENIIQRCLISFIIIQMYTYA